MSEWIWCDERLPEKGQRVIGFDFDSGGVAEAQIAGWGEPHLIFMDTDDCYIIAWMPFPEPPSNEDALKHVKDDNA